MKEKGQIAMEYLILTAFIMIAVAIIFSFSFLNYTQNIKIAKTSEALSKMALAVDDVYTRGEGNNRFETIAFPDGMTEVKVIHKCDSISTENQGTVAECQDGCTGTNYECVEFSALVITVQTIGGDQTMMRETKAKIFENLGEMGEMNDTLNKYSGSIYTVKISWSSSGTIQVEKAQG